jgi:hypothetical protein
MLLIFDVAVPAQDPDQPLVPVAPPQPLAVRLGVLHGEQRLVVLHLVMPVPAPRREKADVQAEGVGLIDDVVHVVPVVIVGTVCHGRAGGVQIDQWQVPVRVRGRVPVNLRQCNSLDHCESFGCPVGEVLVRLLAVEPVEQLPRRSR